MYFHQYHANDNIFTLNILFNIVLKFVDHDLARKMRSKQENKQNNVIIYIYILYTYTFLRILLKLVLEREKERYYRV